MNTKSYLLLRLGIGMSMFGHGLVRMPKLSAFSTWMTKSFENALLPEVLVKPFSYVLPFAELAIGILLLLGLFTRQSLMAGGVVMLALIFGACMLENWEILPSQLIHLAFFAVLLHFLPNNSCALDKLFAR